MPVGCVAWQTTLLAENSADDEIPDSVAETLQASGVTDTAHQLVQGDSDEAQLSWNAAVGAPFIQTASTNASAAGGWEALPQVEGFTLNRTWELVPGAIMPFYSTAGIDPSAVKRALITFPGKCVFRGTGHGVLSFLALTSLYFFTVRHADLETHGSMQTCIATHLLQLTLTSRSA